MPDLEGDEDMAAIFSEFGFCKAGGFGLLPLDWQDLAAFSEMVGYEFTAWQAETLMAMSRDYASIASSDEALPMPYQSDTVDHDAVADRLKKAFGALASRKRGRANG